VRVLAGVTVLLSVACGKSADKASTVTNNAPPQVGKTWNAIEAWRVVPPSTTAAFGQVAPLADGSALVTSYFEDTATVGATTFESRGDVDLLVHRISADGTIGAGTQLGGAGLDADAALVADGDRAFLAIHSKGAVTIAGKTFASDGDRLVTALVTLDRDGKPIAACSIDLDVSIFTLRMIALPDHDLVVSADESHDTKHATVLTRIGADCTPRWRVPLGDIRISELATEGPELILSASGEDWLGLWHVDAITGAVGTKHQLTKPAGASAPDDLGDLEQAQRVDDRVVALGVTGGTAVLDGKAFSGGHLHPFVLTSSPQAASYVPIADVVAEVRGGGRVHGTPFFGMQVIHAGEPADVHRGMYLVAFGSKPQLVPLYQYKYENDDWQNAPKQVVVGNQIRGFVTFSDDAAWIAGVCDDAAKAPCLAKFTLTAK
jgi:hypothetical protein